MRWLALLLSSIALLTSSPVVAQAPQYKTFTDPPHLRSMQFEAPNGDKAKLCMVLPEKWGDCDGINVEALQAKLRNQDPQGATPVAFGVLRYESGPAMIGVSSMKIRCKDMNAAAVAGLAQGMRVPIESAGGRFVQQPQFTQVEGLAAFRAVAEYAAAGQPVRTSLMVFLASDAIHRVEVTTPAGDAEHHQRIVDHVVGTIAYDPGDLGLIGKSRYYILAARAAPLLGLAVVPLFLGGVVWSLFMVRKRNKR